MRAHKGYHSFGFSLVEISVVLVLIAAMTGMFLTLAGQQRSTSQYEDTKALMNTIETALQRELIYSGALPCPARLTAAPNTANFGVATDCAAVAPAGTTDISTIAGTADDIRIGAVPTRALNLPDKVGVDAWNMRLTYVVTEDLAQTKALFDTYVAPASGGIRINDAAGNSLLANTPAGMVLAYAIISHGADKKVAHSPTVSAPIPALRVF
jgi:type II secretory pathway pseudopilin PulG